MLQGMLEIDQQYIQRLRSKLDLPSSIATDQQVLEIADNSYVGAVMKLGIAGEDLGREIKKSALAFRDGIAKTFSR